MRSPISLLGLTFSGNFMGLLWHFNIHCRGNSLIHYFISSRYTRGMVYARRGKGSAKTSFLGFENLPIGDFIEVAFSASLDCCLSPIDRRWCSIPNIDNYKESSFCTRLPGARNYRERVKRFISRRYKKSPNKVDIPTFLQSAFLREINYRAQ